MIRVPKLEMHLAYGCNLRCEHCSHYSNYGPGGRLPLEEGRRWLDNWSARLEPVHFSFLGGEPLLNRAVPEFLALARARWPHTAIRLVTNGLLLSRCDDQLWRALAGTECTLTISVHSRDPAYLREMHPAMACARTQAQRFGVACEARNSVTGWYRMYRSEGRSMRPYDDRNPASSWKACQNKHCLTLESNALWKCPPLAHLPRVARKFRLDLRPEWQVPLQYRPLTLEASDDEIRAFIAKREEPACGMCPVEPEYFEKAVW